MNNTTRVNIYNSLMHIKIPKITIMVTERPPRVVPVMERGSKWSEIFINMRYSLNKTKYFRLRPTDEIS